MSLFYLLYLVPKNWVSYLLGILVSRQLLFNLHSILKVWFARRYRINLEESEFPLQSYLTLGDLFLRRLKIGARTIADSDIVSPVDGVAVRSGTFSGCNPEFTQIKGKTYSLSQLLGGQWDVDEFSPGGYCTLYLAPHNYHWVHCPCEAEVIKVVHIPGALWPVNDWSVQNIDGLFLCNERVIVELKTTEGKLLVVMVGATNVGKIGLVFTEAIKGNQPGQKCICDWYPEYPLHLQKGAPMGYFAMGSTVILIGNRYMAASFVSAQSGKYPIKMGEIFKI